MIDFQFSNCGRWVKLPEKGSVKTRLAKDLDHGFVQTLYRNFVLDLLN